MTWTIDPMPADALPPLDEPKAGRLTIQYAPVAETDVVENPPRFTWLPVIDEGAAYVLRLSSDPKFPAKTTEVFENIALNFFTPDAPLPPGEHYWSYATWDAATDKRSSGWSSTRSFTVDEGVPETPLPSRQTRLAKVAQDHPRLWLTSDRLKTFKSAVKADPDHCTWSTFYAASVRPWMERPVYTEPAGYPNHTRTAPVWRKTYIELQEVWYAMMPR
jgi:hypothetical protein